MGQTTLNANGLPAISPAEGKSANDGKACAGCSVPELSQPTTTRTAPTLPPPPWWTYSARSLTTSPAVSKEAFCEATVTSWTRDVDRTRSEEDVENVSMTSSSRIQSLG